MTSPSEIGSFPPKCLHDGEPFQATQASSSSSASSTRIPSQNSNGAKILKEASSRKRTFLQSLRLYEQGQYGMPYKLRYSPHWMTKLEEGRRLTKHSGCVNTVTWSPGFGEYILTGSDDWCLNLWSGSDFRLLSSIRTSHTQNIFSARFLSPAPTQCVSCSPDGVVLITDLEREQAIQSYRCHRGLTFEVEVDPFNSSLVYSCCNDGTINLYDLRVHQRCEESPNSNFLCSKHVFARICDRRGPVGIPSMDFRTDNEHYFVTGCNDDVIRMFDKRKLASDQNVRHAFTGSGVHDPEIVASEACWTWKWDRKPAHSYRITCIRYDPSGGGDIVASYANQRIFVLRPGRTFPGGNTKGLTAWSKVEEDEDERDARRQERRQLAKADAMRRSIKASSTPPMSDRLDSAIERGERRAQSVGVNDVTMAELLAAEEDEYPSISDDETTSSLSADRRRQGRRRFLRCGSYFSASSDNSDEDDELYDADSEEHISLSRDPFQDTAATDPKHKNDPEVIVALDGHFNSKTMIKEAVFSRPTSSHILSGSDDGLVYIWDKTTGRLVHTFEGDSDTVNCVQPHPNGAQGCVLVSGIDDDVKVCFPTAKENVDVHGNRKQAKAKRESRRNRSPTEMLHHISAGDNEIVYVPERLLMHFLNLFSEARGG